MSDNGLKRQPDAAPCEVVVATFVFDVRRCGRDAMCTAVDDMGVERRVCDDCAFGGAS